MVRRRSLSRSEVAKKISKKRASIGRDVDLPVPASSSKKMNRKTKPQVLDIVESDGEEENVNTTFEVKSSAKKAKLDTVPTEDPDSDEVEVEEFDKVDKNKAALIVRKSTRVKLPIEYYNPSLAVAGKKKRKAPSVKDNMGKSPKKSKKSEDGVTVKKRASKKTANKKDTEEAEEESTETNDESTEMEEESPDQDSPVQKTPTKKTPTKKTPTKKTPTKKTPTKKTPTKKSPAKKSPAKKAPTAKQTVAKAKKVAEVKDKKADSKKETVAKKEKTVSKKKEEKTPQKKKADNQKKQVSEAESEAVKKRGAPKKKTS